MVYIALLALSFVIPGLGDYVVVLIWPVVIPIFKLSIALGGPRDVAIIGFIAGIGQFFLLGLLWDSISGWLRGPVVGDPPERPH